MQELFDMMIEYFLEIKCEEYLFCEIAPMVKKNYHYEYAEEFIKCFEPFI